MVVGTHGNGMFAAYLGDNLNTPPSGSNNNFIRSIFPTLSNQIINYQIGDLLRLPPCACKVINLAGQLLYDRETGYQNGSVYVGLLPKGAYVLAITSSDGKYRYVNKFIKN